MDKLIIPHGLNLDRASLPQVKSTDVPDYIRWLSQHKHYSTVRTELPVASLFLSQGNLNKSKIKHFMTDKRENLRKPVIVSGDHYVIDGHHRVIALLNLDHSDTIPVIMVHAKVLDLIAATKEYPKSFTKNVVESFVKINEVTERGTGGHEKHTVVSFGRFNPPTSGHAQLVATAHEVAKKYSHEGPHIILSHTHDSKKNPLSPANKLKHAKRAFPATHVSISSPKHPTIFHQAAELHKSGTQHLHVIAGGDRVKEFHDSLHKYNGKFDKEGHGYKFKSITVHSAGHRDPNAKGVEGMSASKMREHASSGNFKEFNKGVSPHMSHNDAKAMFHDVRKGQGHLNEAFESEMLSEGVHDAGIFKAVFITGGTGSGKDFVMKKSLHGHGLTEINSDTAFEHLLGKGGLSKQMPEHEKDKRDVARDRAKSITDLRQRLAIHGRNGLIINSTGAKVDQIKKLKSALEDLGYGTKMVFVDASDNVSRNRNIERGQRGGRAIPEELRAKKWREAQDSRVTFSKMFGQEHYHEFNNDEDLRHNTDPEIHSQKTAELDDLFKTVKKFTQKPPDHPVAQEWIYKNLGKLAKQPIGNKQQQTKVIPQSADSQASEEARKLGLQYYGYGKYGKNSRVTHFSLNGKLVEKQKALKPIKPLEKPKTPKKLNEAFEELFTEENDNEHLRLELRMADTDVVGDSMGESVLVQYHDKPSVRLHEASMLVPAGEIEYRDLGSYSAGSGAKEEIQESSQEKVEFGAFRKRLVISGSQGTEEGAQTLSEGEPVLEPFTEPGAILGTGSNELHDGTNLGKATSGPKKTLRSFKKDIK